MVVELPDLADNQSSALVGAVGEALTNAGKHGEARHATVFLEPLDDGSTFCSVKDDGSGFDASPLPDGGGIENSIVRRLVAVGGSVEVTSQPGRGTEVQMWLR